MPSAKAAQLQWGSPQVAASKVDATTTPQSERQPARRQPINDSQVVAAAWEIEDGRDASAMADSHSIVIERTNPKHNYDPFDEDDRLAQLPDDPFDEPSTEALPATDDINAVEEALEQEMQRRRAIDEPLGTEVDVPESSGTIDLEAPLPDWDAIEPSAEGDIDNERMELEQDEFKIPDYQFQTEPEPIDPYRGIELSPEELEERAKELEQERQENEENCRDELEELALDTLSKIDLSVDVEGNAGEDFPFECAVSSATHQPRQWPQITYNWKASALCHKPLYFEQVQLERYGHSWGPYVQPIMSGVHFFGTLPVLPYKMGIRTPTECVYTLGYYRPGSCAPYMIEPIPFTWRAALFEGGVATGISFVVP